MTLSKPIKVTAVNLAACYLQSLYINPIRTKCLTSCIIASLGNYTSQKISGNKNINLNSLRAFAIFGLLFGGTIPHFFFQILERIFPSSSNKTLFLKCFIERVIYTPFYQFFSLYTLSRLEGKSHEDALQQVKKLYKPILGANMKFISMIQILNLSLVPPMFRVLVVNVVGFFWSIFLANKRRQAEEKRNKTS